MAVTPLQAATLANLRGTAALILSASGNNPDVLGVCRRMIQQEPSFLNVLCLAKDSPLARLCAEYEFVRCGEAPLDLRDGFVATNSLLALAIIVSRSYSQLTHQGADIPQNLEELLQASSGIDRWVEALRETCLTTVKRPYLLVLHGGGPSMSAAFDLESKCSEAALAAVQVSDYRNFAHGRHHWLAKKGAETGVLALITEEDSRVAERTLALLPGEVAVAPIRISSKGEHAALAALVAVLYVAGFIGDAKQIDPGKPGVPEFGRRVYHLNAWGKQATGTILRKVAIERKAGCPIQLLSRENADRWNEAYDRFLAQLESTRFEALVLDYDGTVCDDQFRYTTLPSSIASPLESLLRAGARIGVATGRGKSVRAALRQCLGSRWWPQVVIAYHNGAEIAMLDDDDTFPDAVPEAAVMQTVGERLASSVALKSIAQLDRKPYQVTVISTSPANTERVYDLVCDLTADTFAHGITCLRSAHSVDLLAPGITKIRLLERLATTVVAPTPAFLCIGDIGKWPGNDFALLGTPYSLSAHEVSSVPDRCWNLAPAGFRNSQATRWYLEHMEPSDRMLTFRLDRSGE
ncbi:MAG: hypothetical protein WBQ65_10705 [Bryobacteraceae bacterium]